MIKAAIILDLISGLFFAVDFLFPPSIGRSIGNWLVSLLPEKGKENEPLAKKTLKFNIIVSCLAVVGIVIWAMVVDPGDYSAWQVVKSAILYSVGLIVGIIFCIFVPIILNKLPKNLRPRTGRGIIIATWIIGMIIMFVIILALNFIAVNISILAPILIFVISVSMILIVMMSAKTIRKYVDATPNKRVYAISRIGLILFIISKIIYIKYIF